MKRLKGFIFFTVLIFFNSASAIAQQNEMLNGGFENWPDDFAPAGYGAFQAPQKQYDKLRTVFKSPDARSGKSSLRLRNTSIKEFIAAMNINTYGVSFPDQVIPAGIWSCEGNCKIPPKDNLGRARFPVTKRYKTVCGYYKGKLAGGDKLFISIVMFKGSNVMGGSDAGLIQHAFVTQSSDTWKRFEIPVTYFGSDENVMPDAAALQISIVGKSFPQNAFAGGSGQFVTLGTEVLVDDVAFCVGKADVLVFSPKVLNEISPPSGNQNQDSVIAPQENQSTGTNEQIPPNENFMPGAQTFVNLDNDDNDKYFDFNPENEQASDKEVPGGDDELIKIILRIPERTFLEAQLAHKKMTAKLEVTEGAGHIRVWEKDTKQGRLALPKVFQVDTTFTERSGEYLIKEIWVEGILPHNERQQRGTKLKFTHSEDVNFKDEFAITIIGIKKITWAGRRNSIKNSNDLDPDPNHMDPSSANPLLPEDCGTNPVSTLNPKGVRVFPCRRMENGQLDGLPRNIVDVRVSLTVKPVRPVKVYFKSFDVDDPSAAGDRLPEPNDVTNEFWVDDESKKTDNRGFIGEYGKQGKFPGENPDGIVEAEFTDTVKIFPFEVTMQPGDNFRVVGSADQDFLKELRNDDDLLNKGGSSLEKNENKQRIVNRKILSVNPDDIKNAEIREADKYASETLTVWRFLYVEVDYMEKITEDKITGTVKRIVPNQPSRGQTLVITNENIMLNLKNITNVSIWQRSTGVRDCFQDGKMKIGNTTYDVLYNSGNLNGPDTVTINGMVADTTARQTYWLQDDDESRNLKKGDKLEDAITGRTSVEIRNEYCKVADRYHYAYIVPDFKTLSDPAINRTPTSPFQRNVKAYETVEQDQNLIDNYRFGQDANKDKDDFWVVYLLYAYKGATYEDGDPDGVGPGLPQNANREGMISGIADKKKIGIHVFLEGLMERNAGYSATNSRGLGEMDCIVHELAHLFGVEHIDGGQMGVPGEPDKYPEHKWFTQKSLARLRNCMHP